jgi:hypothetical protein
VIYAGEPTEEYTVTSVIHKFGLAVVTIKRREVVMTQYVKCTSKKTLGATEGIQNNPGQVAVYFAGEGDDNTHKTKVTLVVKSHEADNYTVGEGYTITIER